MTWQPDDAVVDRLTRLRAQVDRLIVVDNGSTSATARRIAAWAPTAGARYLRNDANLGLSRPFNDGARMATDDGADWLCIVDQDTVVSPTLVTDLLAARAAHPHPREVAVIGPAVAGVTENRGCAGGLWARRRLVISSGSLLSLAAWRAAGLFREDYFVDMVEAEYCLRLGTLGYQVILACRATIDHRIGHPTTHRILWKSVSTSNHPAWRRYYITRNRIHVWRSYWRHAPAFVAFDVRGQVRDTIYMTLFESGRRAKLRATLAGLRDGMLGRTGELVAPPMARAAVTDP